MPELKPWEMDWSKPKEKKPWERNWATAAEVVKKEEVSQLESGLRGAAQGATLGFSDEITAGLESLLGKKSYEDALKETRDLYKKAQQANPKTYLAGNIGGGIASSALPVVGQANAATGLGRMATAAAQGGIAGYGYGEGKTSEDKLKEIASGLGTGAIAGGFGEGVSAVGSKLSDLAKKLGLIHLRPVPSTVRKLGDERLLEASDEALKSGAIKFGSKAKDTAERLEPLALSAGKKLQDIVENSPAQIDPLKVATRMENEVISPLRKAPAGNETLIAALEKEKNAFLNAHAPTLPQQTIPLSVSEAEKSAFANRAWGTPSERPFIQKLKGFGAILGEEGARAEPSVAFESAKKLSGNLLNAKKMAEKTASIKGLMAHGTDIGTAVVVGDLLFSDDPKKRELGEALALGRMLTKGRVASSGAVASRVGSKILSSDIARNAAIKGLQAPLISSGASNSLYKKIAGE